MREWEFSKTFGEGIFSTNSNFYPRRDRSLRLFGEGVKSMEFTKYPKEVIYAQLLFHKRESPFPQGLS